MDLSKAKQTPAGVTSPGVSLSQTAANARNLTKRIPNASVDVSDRGSLTNTLGHVATTDPTPVASPTMPPQDNVEAPAGAIASFEEDLIESFRSFKLNQHIPEDLDAILSKDGRKQVVEQPAKDPDVPGASSDNNIARDMPLDPETTVIPIVPSLGDPKPTARSKPTPTPSNAKPTTQPQARPSPQATGTAFPTSTTVEFEKPAAEKVDARMSTPDLSPYDSQTGRNTSIKDASNGKIADALLSSVCNLPSSTPAAGNLLAAKGSASGPATKPPSANNPIRRLDSNTETSECLDKDSLLEPLKPKEPNHSIALLANDGGSSVSLVLTSDTMNDISNLVSITNNTPIGTGGFCDLYLGRHETQGKVALKRPRFAYGEPAIIKRFYREVQLWASIKHPYILPCLGTCSFGRSVYMVSPFIENGDLSRCIKSGRAMNRVKILSQIAVAITYLHSINVVHGDIKAANILLSDEDTPLICDFGVAKAFGMLISTETEGMGSTRWMAPELFENAPKTMQSDVYAFGMLITEVLSGKPPLAHILDYAVVAQVLTNDIRPLRSLSEGLSGRLYQVVWDIAEKCWVREARNRPAMIDVSAMFALRID